MIPIFDLSTEFVLSLPSIPDVTRNPTKYDVFSFVYDMYFVQEFDNQ